MNRPRVIGVDLSLRSTGVAGWGWTDNIRPGGKAPTDLDESLERIRSIRDWLVNFCWDADLVVVEGLAFASQTGKASERAGLWWHVVESLTSRCPVAVMTPTARARYATGRGNANKDEVLAAVCRRYPAYEITSNDEADALVLCAAGYDWLGHPIVQVPQTHRDALTKVAWPLDITPGRGAA